MNKVEQTAELFPTQMNCSQSILTIFGESYGLESALAKRLGRSLGGGMGHMAKTCGAVSAAVLVLGLVKDNEDEVQAKRDAFSSVQEFFERFRALHGSTECRHLLGADMSTEDGAKRIQQEDLIRTLCPSYVRSVADILDGLLKS